MWRKKGIAICPVKYGMAINGFNAGVKIGNLIALIACRRLDFDCKVLLRRMELWSLITAGLKWVRA